MAHVRGLLGLGAFVLLSVHLVPNARAADGGTRAPTPPVPACVAIKTASVYVPYGYNHVVTLTNGCAREARCVVASDVNPEQRSVDVPANESREVVTFMGSPSSTFVAKVDCKLK